jgi:hypothetical protein
VAIVTSAAAAIIIKITRHRLFPSKYLGIAWKYDHTNVIYQQDYKA